MRQVKIDWDQATLKDLKMFAAQVLGMMTMPNIGEATLRSKIRQAYSGNHITIMVDEADSKAETQADAPVAPSETPNDGKALRGTSAAGDPNVKITIAEVEGAGGKREVPVGVNGVIMLIPRGFPVDIPYRYYDALAKAIKTTHHQDQDSGEIISSDVPSYPFSVNRMPPQAEIDAFLVADRQAA